MESSCDLIQNLSLMASERDILSCKIEQSKLNRLLNQLLDLLLEFLKGVDFARKVNDYGVEGLRLERSKLFSTAADIMSEEGR